MCPSAFFVRLSISQRLVIKTSFIKALEAEPNQERVPLIYKGD